MNNNYRLNDIERNLRIARFYPLDVLVVGGTGAGKSSTINALFQSTIAKVGAGCDPETMNISSININERLRFWDSPGLGDNIEKDKRYSHELIDLLYRDYQVDDKQYGLIDMVLVILDGSSRDMGTTYKILNEVIVPNLQIDRILVAINQADMAMKGRHWDDSHNCPDRELFKFLEEKVKSIQNRLREATGVSVVKPVYYSAEKNFNVEGLLDLVIDNMPRERRPFAA